MKDDVPATLGVGRRNDGNEPVPFQMSEAALGIMEFSYEAPLDCRRGDGIQRPPTAHLLPVVGHELVISYDLRLLDA